MSEYTVLVVDDEQDIRELLSAVLIANGYAVMTARDGQEALSIVESTGNVVDLIVSDVRMPNMSGITMARKIRQFRPRLPVIMLTGNWDEAEAALPPGSVILRKPFDLDVVLLEVQVSLQPSQACAAR